MIFVASGADIEGKFLIIFLLKSLHLNEGIVKRIKGELFTASIIPFFKYLGVRRGAFHNLAIV